MKSFVEKSRDKFGDKFDYSKTNYSKYNCPVLIGCPAHGDVSVIPWSHLQSLNGCKQCGEEIRIKPRTSFDDFKKKAIAKHGEKYQYIEGSFSKMSALMTIICDIHGEFKQKPNSHLNYGCRSCGYDIVAKVNTVTHANFIIKAQAVHGETYDYCESNYTKAHNKVTIKCLIHGEFIQDAYAHLSGHGCPICGINQRAESAKIPAEDVIQRFIEKHGDKYNYSKVDYVKMQGKVVIICREHGEFEQTPIAHLKGNGCSSCSHIISSAEIELTNFVSQYVEVIKNTKSIIAPYELDCFVPSKNLAIEFNGLVWHSTKFNSEKLYHQRKHLLCRNKGIRLIQVWEDDWTNKRILIEGMILSALGINKDVIYARKTEYREVESKDAREFFNTNHLNGFIPSSKYLGLFHNNILVQSVSISKPRAFMKNQQADIEITRSASLLGTRVIGGLSKLLSKVEAQTISTFADALWYDGSGYKACGFQAKGLSDVGYFYVKSPFNERHHRFKFAKHTLGNQLSIYDERLSELENMSNNGYYRIYDAGHYRFTK